MVCENVCKGLLVKQSAIAGKGRLLQQSVRLHIDILLKAHMYRGSVSDVSLLGGGG